MRWVFGWLVGCFLVWLKCKKGDLGGRYDGGEKERERARWETSAHAPIQQ